ncbi:MAG: ThuA domain-containing protein [Rubripirellula sp.]|nr:ThuA domain-containing protein [Rubripirellula sp.]
MFSRLLTCLCLLIGMALSSSAQHSWQRSPTRDPKQIAKIVGPIRDTAPTRDLKIVWVWGTDQNHAPGFHEYIEVKDMFEGLLQQVPRVTFEAVEKFPTEQHWATADLVVFYAQLDTLLEQDFDQIDSYLRRGGGIVAIHAAMIQPGEELAARFGLAWDPGNTQWGVLPIPATIDPATPTGIMKGFPAEIELVDEHYWNLLGSVDDITVLATAPAGVAGPSTEPPEKKTLDGKAWPLFWVKEVSKGRVFGSIPGHNRFTFDDPYFRIILLRAMAWTMRQPFDPFKPLIITDQ